MSIDKKSSAFSNKIEKTTYVLLLTIVLILALFAHTYYFNLDLKFATSGFSIIEVLQAHENPIGFSRDYPGGARLTTAVSPLIYLYFLGNYLGLNWMAMVYVMIFLEMCTLLFGAWLFWKALFFNSDDASPGFLKIVNFGFIWVACFMLISSIQRANLDNFGFPYFHGQFYGFADGLRLATLAMLLRHRWIAAALLFSLCFVIHPIKAVIAAGFAIPFVFFDWRLMLTYRFVVAAILTSTVCSIWYINTLSLTTDSVPISDFIAYTRTLQSHWYPFDVGLFGDNHLRGISPFMALILVIQLVLTQDGWGKELRKKLQFGFISLLILVGLGLYFSVDERSATLIRICLVRASNLISLLAPLIIVAGAVFACREQKWSMAAGLLAFLWTSFTTSIGDTFLPPMFALCLVALDFYQTKKINYYTLTTTLCVATGMIWLSINFSSILIPIYAIKSTLIAALGFWILFKLTGYITNFTYGIPIVPLIISAVFIYGGWQYANQKSEAVLRNSEISHAYLEAQRWAHSNTNDAALFMVDPCRAYGWRDFSGRASIGTIREWYMTAWIYTDRRSLLEKGKEIAATLGFDMKPFRNAPGSYKQRCKAARSAYYDPALNGIKQIAKRYDVDFFVFDKKYAGSLPSKLEQKSVFRNEHFFITASEELKQ